MEHYSKLFKIGDRLILELKGGQIFEGIYADGGKDRITLTDATQHNNKNKLLGLYDFHRNEIAKIHTLKKDENATEDKNIEISETKEVKPIEEMVKVKMAENDYFSLKEMARNYIYLENCDKRYYDAIDVLNHSETVGVCAYGMDSTRFASVIRLLALSNWEQVYLLDLSNCDEKKIYPEIKEILENSFICKVVHKGAGLVDVLNSAYGVYTKNVFDTQVVDMIFQKQEKPKKSLKERNVAECLVHYLNFPKSLLSEASEITKAQWNERPLPEKRKFYASQLVTYLIVLKEHFNKMLLSQIYNTIETVQNHVDNLSDYDFGNYVSHKDVPKDIENLIPTLKNLGLKNDVEVHQTNGSEQTQTKSGHL